MKCPICSREQDADAVFCTACGKKIPRCPTCGTVLYERGRFCVVDGTPLPEELFADLPRPPAPPPAAGRAAAAPAPPPPAARRTPPPPAAAKAAPPPAPPVKRKKSRLPVVLAILLVLLLAAGAGGYFLYQQGLLPFFQEPDSPAASRDDDRDDDRDEPEEDGEEPPEETPGGEEKDPPEEAPDQAQEEAPGGTADAPGTAPEPPAPLPEPADPVSMEAVDAVEASSYLSEAQYKLYHTADLAIDGDLATAWVEGASGNGVGESITFTFDGVYLVSGLYIHAGYQKSASLYEKNARPASLTVTFSNGESQTVTLEDVNGPQDIPFPAPVETGSVTLVIASVYSGSKYEDTAISEIAFY